MSKNPQMAYRAGWNRGKRLTIYWLFGESATRSDRVYFHHWSGKGPSHIEYTIERNGPVVSAPLDSLERIVEGWPGPVNVRRQYSKEVEAEAKRIEQVNKKVPVISGRMGRKGSYENRNPITDDDIRVIAELVADHSQKAVAETSNRSVKVVRVIDLARRGMKLPGYMEKYDLLYRRTLALLREASVAEHKKLESPVHELDPEVVDESIVTDPPKAILTFDPPKAIVTDPPTSGSPWQDLSELEATIRKALQAVDDETAELSVRYDELRKKKDRYLAALHQIQGLPAVLEEIRDL